MKNLVPLSESGVPLNPEELKLLLEKGGPGSGFHGHSGRPGMLGGSSSIGGRLAEFGFKQTGGDANTTNGTLVVFQDGFGAKALLRTLKGVTTLTIEPSGIYGSKIGPGRPADVLEDYAARVGSMTFNYRMPQSIHDRLAKGGPGSGNFGHEGRPGLVGGSGPGGGGDDRNVAAREAAGNEKYPGQNFKVGPPTEAHPQGRNWVDKIPGQPEDTLKHYTRADGTLTPERQALHDEIKSEILSRATPVGPDQKPVAVLMMGGTASGKSTLVDALKSQNMVVADADEVKTKLPEFKEATKPELTSRNAAFMVHEESSKIGKEIVTSAIESRKNIVIDGTGGSSTGVQKYGKTIDRLKAAGYDVKLIMTDLDGDTAVKRMQGRAETTGRLVPEHVMKEIYSTAPPNFIPIGRKVDSFMLYDNRVPKGTPPRLVWSKSSGKETIHDDAFVSAWKAKYPESK